jgi:hypothetical protein
LIKVRPSFLVYEVFKVQKSNKYDIILISDFLQVFLIDLWRDVMQDERQPWLQKARKQHYRTLIDWIEALRELGWEGINESTVRNWEAAGFLPTSLDYKTINLVADSLHMTPNEILRMQGVKLVERFGNIQIPSSAANLVEKICQTSDAKLEKIMPLVERFFNLMDEQIED